MGKRYLIFIVALLLAGPVVATVPFAVGVDPYRVFGWSGYNNHNFFPNTRYMKTEHLLKHTEFDAFVLGSSRANYYRDTSLQRYTGHRWYNLNVSAETAEGLLARVRWLLDSRTVRQLLIPLDYDMMFQVKAFREGDLLRMEHPAVSGGSWLQFYWWNLTVPYRQLTEAVRRIQVTDVVLYELNMADGHYRMVAQEELMLRFPEEHARTLDMHFVTRKEGAQPWQLEAFDQLVALLKERKVAAVFVVNPLHAAHTRSFDPVDYSKWLMRLAQSGLPVWDFSGYNTITTDNHYYVDNSHFVWPVGEMVLARVFGDGAQVPPDFGVRLTPDKVRGRFHELVEGYLSRSR